MHEAGLGRQTTGNIEIREEIFTGHGDVVNASTTSQEKAEALSKIRQIRNSQNGVRTPIEWTANGLPVPR